MCVCIFSIIAFSDSLGSSYEFIELLNGAFKFRSSPSLPNEYTRSPSCHIHLVSRREWIFETFLSFLLADTEQLTPVQKKPIAIRSLFSWTLFGTHSSKPLLYAHTQMELGILCFQSYPSDHKTSLQGGTVLQIIQFYNVTRTHKHFLPSILLDASLGTQYFY